MSYYLSGPGTDQAQVEMLKEGIMAGKDISVCLLNYRADGTPFFNQVYYNSDNFGYFFLYSKQPPSYPFIDIKIDAFPSLSSLSHHNS